MLMLLLVAGVLAVMVPGGPPQQPASRGAWPVPPSTAGVNLYIGNGPEANGFYVAVVPGDWRPDPAGAATWPTDWGCPDRLAEADRIWAREAWRAMAQNPARTAGLWMKKVWLHLQGWEIDQLVPLDRWRRAAPALAWLLGSLCPVDDPGRRGCWLPAGRCPGYAFWAPSWSRAGRRPEPVFRGVALSAGAGSSPVPAGRPGSGRDTAGEPESHRGSSPGGPDYHPLGPGRNPGILARPGLSNEALRWAEIGMADDSAEALQTAETLYREALEMGRVRIWGLRPGWVWRPVD